MNHDEPIEGLVKALHTTSPFYKNSTFENERKFIKRRLKCFKILIVILVILCCVLIGFVIFLTLFPQSGVFFKPLSPLETKIVGFNKVLSFFFIPNPLWSSSR